MSIGCRDHQKSKVYAAQHQLQALYDATGGGGAAEVLGVGLMLEPEDRFTGLAAVQVYTDRVLRHPDVAAAFGAQRPVRVRHRKGDRAAHYEVGGVIAVHVGSEWALRETVLLHELAHHLAPGDQHGPRFAAAMTTLVGAVLGPQAGLALRMLLDANGAAVG